MLILLLLVSFVCAENEFKCEQEGLYCVNDGKHDTQYYECSEVFQGYKPCVLGKKCTSKERVALGFNPCTTPSKAKEGQNLCLNMKGYYCVNDGEHTTEFLLCEDTYKGYMKCPKGTHCGFKGQVPENMSPCVLDESSKQKSEEKSTSKSSEKSKEPDTPSVDTPSEEDICKDKSGYYCLDDVDYVYQYLWCSDSYKGYMKCPKGTYCGYDGKAPDNQSPCVLEVEPKDIIDPKDLCKNEGFMCINDGKHDSQYLVCSESYKGYMYCSEGTKCSGKSYMNFTENPCVGVDRTVECKKDGFFCLIDGKHNDKYFQCSSEFTGFRQCPKDTWCKKEQSEPFEESPCVWLDQTEW
ncbi:Cyst wall-specific glycoprotein Jacob family protein [Entamoeba invadens IP1]|uniref:Jacob 3 n=1 Tax=Entamoeba invadens TaxID=33085 RepID=Q2LEC0_ENTIV|nr:Cyst wall-specific glycoprotein Jacob family protein [Entamoeba invadens IP1]ABC59318.2 Jacob 3 [Entamoeba invadens]ELP90687.1 Cyst wall-specific glycoprotein Jacob family protein [Entamoeba invadens IP1]|eukprot:XP_004257458.1 Cyst wall-specific glycoprotein Jacob family protein [Entamoeba invadens IP1]